MSFFGELISFVGGGAVLIAAAAWLAKKLAEHKLLKDYEDYKKRLGKELEEHRIALNKDVAILLEETKYEFQKELLVRKGDLEKEMFIEKAQFDIFRDEIGHLNEKDSERQARVRGQILKWANPILGSIKDLTARLNNILENEGYMALSKDQKNIPKQWSIDYQYFMSSTIFYFAQYFCWTQLLKDKMSFELFQSQREKDNFLDAIDNVGSTISDFPYHNCIASDKEIYDKQVFKLQQRAIGEALVIRSDSQERIMTYKEFINEWQGSEKLFYEPLEEFLRDLKQNDDTRWNRLIDMKKELDKFENVCNGLLAPKQ